jgi:hypothetical protein
MRTGSVACVCPKHIFHRSSSQTAFHLFPSVTWHQPTSVDGWWVWYSFWIKLMIVWDVTPCTLVGIYPHFRGTYVVQSYDRCFVLLIDPWIWRQCVTLKRRETYTRSHSVSFLHWPENRKLSESVISSVYYNFRCLDPSWVGTRVLSQHCPMNIVAVNPVKWPWFLLRSVLHSWRMASSSLRAKQWPE